MNVALSSLSTSLARYSRSWGLWLLLLVAPVGARYCISRDDGSAIVISVNNHLPVLTSAMVGVSLGIVVSTLLLPIGFLYLRSNTTRRQPWQVEEVTAGSRVAMALGRFAADVAVLAAVLGALTIAGWFLAWLSVKPGELNLGQIAFGLWIIAGPSLMGLAAIRAFLDALRMTRGALGELVYFCLWIASLAAPIGAVKRIPGFWPNLTDFGGFVMPLIYSAPPGTPDFQIGGGTPLPGHIPLDVWAGLLSPGYIPARLTWMGIAVAVTVMAGLIYQQHRPARQRTSPSRLARLLSPGAPPKANPMAPAASATSLPVLGLLWAEFRLIGSGRIFLVLATLIAASGLGADFRHITSPAALLLLCFALTAQAGRSEPAGLLKLTQTSPLGPNLRRACFVVAGTAWMLAMSLPAILTRGPAGPALLAVELGAGASLAAMLLATLSRSAFAPRLVLLAAWYVYMST